MHFKVKINFIQHANLYKQEVFPEVSGGNTVQNG